MKSSDIAKLKRIFNSTRLDKIGVVEKISSPDSTKSNGHRIDDKKRRKYSKQFGKIGITNKNATFGNNSIKINDRRISNEKTKQFVNQCRKIDIKKKKMFVNQSDEKEIAKETAVTLKIDSAKLVDLHKNVKRRKIPSKDETENRQPNSLDTLIKSSMFRFLNEKLYTCTSQEAVDLYNQDAEAFQVYHTGYQHQLAQWPDDPLLWISTYLNNMPLKHPTPLRVADMGCGDARLADMLDSNFEIFSFDLVALNDKVTACDMAHTLLKNSSVSVVVFCLSLMGTNCRDFIYEANRIMKLNGELLIVDVASRFDGQFNQFLKLLGRFGFQTSYSEVTEDTYFVRARLKKMTDCTTKPVSHLPVLKLNPCLYKKR